MNGEMVRAVLSGRKTQTRRLVQSRRAPISFLGGRGEEHDLSCWGWAFDGPDHHGYMVLERGLNERFGNGRISIPCPYGEPGDRLWIRETWYDDFGGADLPRSCDVDGMPDGILYRADHDCRNFEAGCPCNPDGNGKRSEWRPSIHMPRWASRLTLEVTGIRVERLQDISEEDAKAEGVMPWSQADVKRVACPCGPDGPEADPDPHVDGCAWGVDDEIDPDIEPHRAAFALLWNRINGKRAPWASNPWIWVVSFRRAT